MQRTLFLPVLDDEDSRTITAGSIVTVTVRLVRQNMDVLMDASDRLPVEDIQAAGVQEKEEEEEPQEDEKQVGVCLGG